jgi:hypothetical protein
VPVVPHPDFLDALADGRHGLEIVGLFAALHLFQLVARIVPGVIRELPQALERIPKESQ